MLVEKVEYTTFDHAFSTTPSFKGSFYQMSQTTKRSWDRTEENKNIVFNSEDIVKNSLVKKGMEKVPSVRSFSTYADSKANDSAKKQVGNSEEDLKETK